jgi:hemerythrin
MARVSEKDGTGVQEIDSEHDLLLGVLRALETAVASGKQAEVEVLLQQLAEYTRVHFATEDIMMRLYAYPGFATHQLEHARLVDQIEQVRSEYAQGHVKPSRSFTSALRHWLTEHIRTHDVGLARFVRENTASPP